jgi:ankyrin repeat protein
MELIQTWLLMTRKTQCYIVLLKGASVNVSKGANADARNYKGQTALHLAAHSQSLEYVEMLLSTAACDPNAVDNDVRLPVHSAVGKSLLAFEITEVLLMCKA